MARVCFTFCSTSRMVTPLSLIRRMTLKFSFTKRGDRPRRRFVDDEQFRPGHEPAPDRKHRLLPARHGTRKLVEALFEPREGVEHSGEPRFEVRVVVSVRANEQILPHRHFRKDFAAFRNAGNAATDDAVCRQAGDLLAIVQHAPAARWRQRQDGADQRAFSGAVDAEDAGNFPGPHAIDTPAQNIGFVVADAEVLRGSGHWTSQSSPR